MTNPLRKSPGPGLFGFVVFLALIIALYFPIRDIAIPATQELWFKQVTRRLVQDARGLLPATNTLWLGATTPELPQSLYGMYELQTTFQGKVSMVSFYQAWGDGVAHEFPEEALTNMSKAGFLPLVTWEPWLSAFAIHQGKEPDSSMALIASGRFDAYIRSWARGAVRFGKPLFLRPAHEVSNPQYPWSPPYGNSASTYQQFWRHVHDIFRQEGARNVLFVWTPYGLQDQAFFPGKTLVDWVGIDLFNYGGLSEQGTWLDFYTLAKLYVDQYRGLQVPLMVTEVATSSSGGSKADWIRDMFRSLKSHELPELQALVLFDIPSGQTSSGLPVNWGFREDSALQRTYQPEQFENLFSPRSPSQNRKTHP
jgi:hypothetical protein